MFGLGACYLRRYVRRIDPHLVALRLVLPVRVVNTAFPSVISFIVLVAATLHVCSVIPVVTLVQLE